MWEPNCTNMLVRPLFPRRSQRASTCQRPVRLPTACTCWAPQIQNWCGQVEHALASGTSTASTPCQTLPVPTSPPGPTVKNQHGVLMELHCSRHTTQAALPLEMLHPHRGTFQITFTCPWPRSASSTSAWPGRPRLRRCSAMSASCPLRPPGLRARSARMLPMTGANLKPCPLQAEARTTCRGARGQAETNVGAAGGAAPQAGHPPQGELLGCRKGSGTLATSSVVHAVPHLRPARVSVQDEVAVRGVGEGAGGRAGQAPVCYREVAPHALPERLLVGRADAAVHAVCCRHLVPAGARGGRVQCRHAQAGAPLAHGEMSASSRQCLTCDDTCRP